MEPAILLIEDDREISSMIAKHLEREGMRVIQAFDGQAALTSFQQNAISLVLLDLMLPKRNGMDLLPLLRQESTVPILILSAKNSELDKALGLGLGADDYIAKPFSLIELTARVRAAIRRSTLYTQAPQAAPTLQTIGDLEIDLDNFRVLKQGQELKLTPKEFLILKLLVGNPQRVFSKAQIYREVWEDEYFGDENVLNVHIRRLREKIEDDPANPRYVQTVWGIGYKLGSL
jgi:Response regulators consisting of a CheY-like receiver domain and a winged-helix DNA-binding domain